MTEWKAKRFWKAASVEAAEGGFQVLLDGRPVKTPGKLSLILPSRAMAEAMAAEWDAQEDEIDPRTMPVTRGANTAIDRVVPQQAEIAEMLAAYGETDLMSHRADSPQALIDRQAAGWDPLLDWAAETIGARLHVTAGVLPVAQPEDSLKALHQALKDVTPFQMVAIHDLITLSGSIIIGLAVAKGRVDPETGWHLSRIDEGWQIEQWGEDEEASEAAANKHRQFLEADRFWHLSSPDGASMASPRD